VLWPGVNGPFYVWDLLCKPYWGLSLARPKKHLIDGVPTGYLRNIPSSHCFEQTADADDDPPPLSVHFDGWKSAHDDPAITTELVEEELRQGWVFEFPGTLEDAQAAFPIGVSVGKLGVATSTTRSPRLVVDSSICGLNQNCPLPEKGSLPSAKDLIRSPFKEHLCSCLWIKLGHQERSQESSHPPF